MPRRTPTAALRATVGRAAARALRRLDFEVDGAGSGAVVIHRGTATDWVAQERAVMAAVSRRQLGVLLDLYGVNCVLDVGAYKGQYARLMRRAGYTGRIVSFEPVPKVFERLRRRAAADPAWEVRPVALGSEDGETTMRVVPGTLSSMLPATSFGERRYQRLREPESVTVPVRRLDGLLDELVDGIAEPRVFLKLDTQGFDLEAFAGAGERVSDVVALQSEVALLSIYENAPRMGDAIATYEQAGFEVAALYPVTRHGPTARVLEYDCVMVRASAARRRPRG